MDTDLSKTVDVLHSPESGRSLIDSQSVIYTTRRPALMPHVDPAVSLARRLLWLPFNVLFPKNDAYIMTLPLAEEVIFSRASTVPKSVYVELQAGQDIQTYETAVTMTAKLRGLRWILHNYRIVSFITLTVGFWSIEMLFAGLTLFALGVFVSNETPPKLEPAESDVKEEQELGEVKLEAKAHDALDIKGEYGHGHGHEPQHEHRLERRSSDEHGGLRRRRSTRFDEEGDLLTTGAVDIKQEPDSD